jgi:hypothetical protein
MSNGSNPYVIRVTIEDGQIVLTVRVDDFPSDASIELSGYAIQDGNAFASFYDIQSVTKNPDGTAIAYLRGTPTEGFKNGVPVTVALRVARAWISVLTESAEYGPTLTNTTAPDGTVWDTVETVGQVSEAPWRATQRLAGAAGPGAESAGPPPG